MESSWFTLVCITAVYFAQQSHGVPRTPVDLMDATLLAKTVQDPVAVQVSEKRDGIVARQAEFNPTLDSLDVKNKAKDSVKSKVYPRMAEDNVGVRKERVQESEESPRLDVKSSLGPSPSLKVTFPEDPKQAMVGKVEDDSIRSKKSTTMRDSFSNVPHVTTVCIQVRSDHNNQVVCGPQVTEDNKEVKPNHSPRFASQGSEYYQQSLYGRTSQNSLPVRPAAASGMTQYIQQSSIPKASGPPAAAKGPVMLPVMRSEDTSAISGQPQFQATQIPSRIIPATPTPSSVLVHRQFYQGGPIPAGAPQGYQTVPSSPWSAMRLNCMPDYYQLPIGSNALLRSASFSPDIYQIGDQIIPLDQQASLRMANPQAIDNSLYVMDGQARQAMSDQALNSAYGYSAVDPMLGAAYIGEDGRAYFLDESQARSAMSEEQMLMRQLWEQQYQRASAGMSVEQLQKQNHDQQEELRTYQKKMHQLQEKLQDIEQRANVDDIKMKKGEMSEESHSKPEGLPSEDVKKIDPQAKTSKRQANRNKS